MEELFTDDAGLISGGLLPAAAVLIWLLVPSNRDQVGDFFEGVFEGYGQNQQAHK
jgi:hypothetical protein